uniref:Uncharacterized protein n=1 Tax=Romanomermis culicivorax TaxID=13658 RepID=A0A915JCQ7_ROMCU
MSTDVYAFLGLSDHSYVSEASPLTNIKKKENFRVLVLIMVKIQQKRLIGTILGRPEHKPELRERSVWTDPVRISVEYTPTLVRPLRTNLSFV